MSQILSNDSVVSRGIVVARILFAAAAFIASLAALVFALRGGSAQADTGGGVVGRYQLTTVRTDNSFLYDIIDTTTGSVFEAFGPDYNWAPLSQQLGASGGHRPPPPPPRH